MSFDDLKFYQAKNAKNRIFGTLLEQQFMTLAPVTHNTKQQCFTPTLHNYPHFFDAPLERVFVYLVCV